MKPPLDFYPSRKSITSVALLAAFFVLGSAMFIALVVSEIVFPADSKIDWMSSLVLAGFGIVCASFGATLSRSASRMRGARKIVQPQLSFDKTGVTIRDTFFWANYRFDWKQFDDVAAVDDKPGISIFAIGDFGRLGRNFDIQTDDCRSSDEVNALLKPLMLRPQ